MSIKGQARTSARNRSPDAGPQFEDRLEQADTRLRGKTVPPSARKRGRDYFCTVTITTFDQSDVPAELKALTA